MGRKPKPKQVTDRVMEPTFVCSEVTYIEKENIKEDNIEKIFKTWIYTTSDFPFSQIDLNLLFGGGWNIGDDNTKD